MPRKHKEKQRPTREWFSVREAARLSGLQPAMVDYLCRSGILLPSGNAEPPGRGGYRKYLFEDLVLLRAVKTLLECGISVAKLKRALALLREREERITEAGLPAQYLVTDGKTVFFRSREEVVEDLLEGGQLAFQFVIELQQLYDDVVRGVENLRTGSAGGMK